MTVALDVVVVGAGVVGLSTARRLARRGASVAVLDASDPGGDGSRAAAGVAVPSVRLFSDPPMLAFARAGRRRLLDDLDELGIAARATHGCGVVRIAADARARDDLAAAAGAGDALGRWVPAPELAALEPALDGCKAAGGFVDDDGCVVDTDEYVGALARDAAAAGASLATGERVAGIYAGAGRVEVHTETRTLECERVVVAAGAWSGSVAGLPRLPVRPVRGQMMAIRPPIEVTRVLSARGYVAPWPAGLACVGATEEDAGFDASVTSAGLLFLAGTVVRVAPRLADAPVARAWAGLRAATPSGRPLVGPYPGVERAFVATGHGGQGILTGALTGAAVAAALCGEGLGDLERFAPGREEAGA